MRGPLAAALAAAFAFGCAGGRQLHGPSALDRSSLDATIGSLTRRAYPGVLGVAVKDLASGDTWSLAGSRRFPMQSVFKLPLGAAVLSAVDRGEVSLTDSVRLTAADLSPPYSPIAAVFPERTTYTIEELLVAAAGGSDNTAADVLMRRIGGPAAVTRWLASHGVPGLRVDRYEREFQIELNAMPPFRAEWAKDSAFLAALNAVPAESRRRATAAYLVDPRDTSTPLAAVAFLEKLERGALLSGRHTELLLRIATETMTGAGRIKAGIPPGATVAHKTGSARPDLGMNPAINDIGVVRLADRRRFAVAIFLAGSTLPYTDAEALHAEVTRAVVQALR